MGIHPAKAQLSTTESNMTTELISNLTTAQVVSLTLQGHLKLDADGTVVYTDKAARAADRDATKARRQGVLTELTEFFASPQGQQFKFFSIKPTGGSFAAAAAPINRYVEASREDILWSLKQLEKNGQARQVGIKAVEDAEGKKTPKVVAPSEVNNFQRRWVHEVPAAEVEAEDEQSEA